MEFQRPVRLYQQIALSFAGLAVIAVIMLLIFSLPYANITIIPKEEDLTVDFIETVSGNGGGVAGRIVQTEVSGVKSFSASLQGSGEPDIARGKVTIFNKSSQEMTLIPTTRLLSEGGVLFRMDKRVTVKAGGQIETSVYADQKGASGNIPPSRFTVPGLGASFEKIVYGESSAPMKGGVKAEAVVTAEDITKAKEDLKKELLEKAALLMEGQKRLGETLLKDASRSIVLLEKADAAESDKKDSFNAEMKLQVQGLFSNELEILELAKKELMRAAGAEKEIISVDNSSLKYVLEKYDEVEKSAQIRISLTGKVMFKKSGAFSDKKALVGMKKQQVIDYFKEKPGVEDVKVKFSPFWVRKVPRLQDHINIVVQK